MLYDTPFWMCISGDICFIHSTQPSVWLNSKLTLSKQCASIFTFLFLSHRIFNVRQRKKIQNVRWLQLAWVSIKLFTQSRKSHQHKLFELHKRNARVTWRKKIEQLTRAYNRTVSCFQWNNRHYNRQLHENEQTIEAFTFTKNTSYSNMNRCGNF